MPFGILEPRNRHAPGTVTILEDRKARKDSVTTQTQIDPRLKYDRSGKEPVLLVPQPTDDPDDPLNWPLWQRDLILVCLSLQAIVATTLSPLLAANSLTIAFHFFLDFNAIALLTGWHLLAVGIGAMFFVPSARIWGKRHVYLLGSLLVCAGSAWAGASSNSYVSLLWARVFQGLGVAPFESLVNASVGDLFFVHERGRRMALSNLSVFGGAFFTPVIVGVITDSMGWEWCFYFVSIFSGIGIFLVLFFVPETTYRRPRELELSEATTGPSFAPRDEDKIVENFVHNLDKDPETVASTSNGEFYASGGEEEKAGVQPRIYEPVKMSFFAPRRLLPFNGRKSDESFFKLFLRPIPLFLQPAVLWACLTQGAIIGWTVLIGIVLASIMLGPPLWFASTQVGYMYSAAFIGALCGFLISGLVTDSSAKWMTKRNKGVYEPEMRLPLLGVFFLLFSGIGLYGFGWTANNTYVYHWIDPCIFFAFEVAGMVCGAVQSSLYIVDAHRDITVEAFTLMILFKNVFSFGLTYRGYQWITDFGTNNTFNVVASIQVGICMLAVPMYVFGKWNRSFWANKDLMSKLK